jgi:hypothetical protein
MSLPVRRLAVIALVLVALIPLEAATVSRQTADAFAVKLALIQRQGSTAERAGALQTLVTEDELNSWLMYLSQPLLPDGLAQPEIALVGAGRLTGRAIVDLDTAVRPPSTAGGFDPLSLISGQVPITVTGVLHASDGMMRFEVETADVSGIQVPVVVLQELASYYLRLPDRPQGVQLDDVFALPAGIIQINVGQGQAVVVQ